MRAFQATQVGAPPGRRSTFLLHGKQQAPSAWKRDQVSEAASLTFLNNCWHAHELEYGSYPVLNLRPIMELQLLIYDTPEEGIGCSDGNHPEDAK